MEEKCLGDSTYNYESISTSKLTVEDGGKIALKSCMELQRQRKAIEDELKSLDGSKIPTYPY